MITTIVSFSLIMIIIIGAYVYAIIRLRFSVFIILTYIVALLASVLIFSFRLSYIQRYLYNKPMKVRNLKRPMELPPIPEIFSGFMIRTRTIIPYFLLKQNEQGTWVYHDILEGVDQYQSFQMIQYNRMYALIKDDFGHYYITFLDDLEIDYANTKS